MTSHKSTPGVGEFAWTEQEHELLGAARTDRMPRQLEARLREALELQLGAATISGAHSVHDVHDVASRSPSLTQADAPHSPQAAALDRSARVSQLFGSKLPLWGVLSIVALGSIAYFGLRSAAPPTAALGLQSPAPEPAHGSALDPIDAASASSARSVAAHTTRTGASAADTGAIDSATENSAHADARFASVGDALQRGQGKRAPTAAGPRARAATSGRGEAAVSGDARAARGGDAVAVRAAAESSDGSAARDVGAPGASGSAQRVVGAASDGLAAQSGVAAPARDRLAAVSSGDELRIEAELLDRARRALSRGALQEARSLLARYAARFERGVLRPESDVLGIELEMRTGAERAAESHAARFLASYPKHPLRERVRELVAKRAVTAVE